MFPIHVMFGAINKWNAMTSRHTTSWRRDDNLIHPLMITHNKPTQIPCFKLEAFAIYLSEP